MRVCVCVQELDEAELLYTAARPQPRSPRAADLSQLPYLNAVFHEAMRVLPPAPFGTIRSLPETATIGGHTLRKGTSIVVSPYSVHHNKANWGDDAGAWRPARWLEGRSLNAVKRDATGALRWLPFSVGTQNCIGQHLASVRLPCKTDLQQKDLIRNKPL